MNLIVDIPRNYFEERRYILDVLLHEFLGLKYLVQRSNRRNTRITAADGLELIVEDYLFQTPEECWLTESSLPQRPLEHWNASWNLGDYLVGFCQVPVIYGNHLSNGQFFQRSSDGIRVSVDIFGSAFFMLSRYEEAVKPDRDKHDRFPATASLAYQESFLDRPIVNEYLEILRACIRMLWPQLEFKARQYQVLISHDVDHPLAVLNKSWLDVLRNAAGDLLYRKDVWLVPRRVYARLVSARGDFDADPGNTFNFMMDISEHYGFQEAYYFITDHSAGSIDGDYLIESPWVRKLMQRIYVRGHEIGLHPSYNTFRDVEQTKREFLKLLALVEKDGIKQNEWGGRQHYLRWDPRKTWQILEDVGLSYDSTLTFADQVGFRCGVCYEFPTYNLVMRNRLNLRERPLVVMDNSLFGQDYMRLDRQAAKLKILEFSRTCKKFNGQFTFLWHNSELLASWQKHLYKEIVECLV